MFTRKWFWVWPVILMLYGSFSFIIGVFATHSLMGQLVYLLVVTLGYEILGLRKGILDWREGRGDQVLTRYIKRITESRKDL